MKKLVTFALGFWFLVTFQSIADLDTNLVAEINRWQKDDAPPARLLKFPDGKIDDLGQCGLTFWGADVGDYISQIQNEELLTALLFDSRAQSETLRDAARKLIELKGVENLARLLVNKKNNHASSISRPELAVLFQLVHSPYIGVQVARIAPEDMNGNEGEKALQAMKQDLVAGMTWADAYEKHSDLHPDVRDRLKDPNSVRTLVSYLYDGVVSPEGFDILDYRIADTLPAAHLRELFRAAVGTYVLQGDGGVYLYHVSRYWNGLSSQAGRSKGLPED